MTDADRAADSLLASKVVEDLASEVIEVDLYYFDEDEDMPFAPYGVLADAVAQAVAQARARAQAQARVAQAADEEAPVTLTLRRARARAPTLTPP